jgi:hypothetical protein
MLTTKPTLTFIAAIATANIVSPVFAQPLYHSDETGADRQVVRQYENQASVRITASARAACMPDAVRLCRDALPDVQNVLICFGQNRHKISNRCLAVLASYGLQ